MLLKRKHPLEREKKPPMMKQEKNKKIDERFDEPRQRRMRYSLSKYKNHGMHQNSSLRPPFTLRKSDENVQSRWKLYEKHSGPLNHDEKSQDGRKNNRKQRSPGYVKLNLQSKLINGDDYEPQVNSATKKDAENITKVVEMKENEISDKITTPPQENSENATERREKVDKNEIIDKPPRKDDEKESNNGEKDDQVINEEDDEHVEG